VFAGAILADPVRLKRITAFLDVEGNKFDSSYQLWQGMLAFAAGGVTGVGLGNGRQQLSFLPEAHNDFIFPVIGEELGLFFSSGVVILYGVIFFLGVKILRLAPNLFYFSLASGSLLCIIFQALINIGVVTGLLPTKGMSLPFISYGGTNLILVFVLIGVLLNCLRTWSKQPLDESREL
ncbi:MAG: FtsW/RodA/SpoVE family cell cycle protein, partial [Candidatus Paceibacterales bacterium]